MYEIRRVLVLMFGIATVLVVAELGLRAAQGIIPASSDWPTPESHLKSQQLAEIGDGVDVLFLGSSITEAAVDPDLIASGAGLGVYNSAMPFMSPAAFEVWYRDVVRGHGTPDLVVLGLPPWPFDRERDLLSEGIVSATRDSVFRAVGNLSALVEHRGVLADWDRLRARSLLIAGGSITDLGHQTGYYDRVGGHFEGLEGVGGGSVMSDSQQSALERTIAAVRSDGGDVVILLEPSYQYVATGTQAYQDMIRQLAARWGVSVWDMYQVAWDSKWFADEVHFNRHGTIAISEMLAELVDS